MTAQVSYRACYLGTALYVIPLLFVIYPALLLEGSWYQIFFVSLKATIIVLALCSVYMGRFRKRLAWIETLLFIVAVLSLVAGKVWTPFNAIGFLAFGLAAVYNGKSNRIEKE